MKKILIILVLVLVVGCSSKSSGASANDNKASVASHCSLITKNSFTDLPSGEKTLLSLIEKQGTNFKVLAFSSNDGGNVNTKYDTVLKTLLKYVGIGSEKEKSNSKGIGAPNFVTELVLNNGEKLLKIVLSHDGYALYVNNQLLAIYEKEIVPIL